VLGERSLARADSPHKVHRREFVLAKRVTHLCHRISSRRHHISTRANSFDKPFPLWNYFPEIRAENAEKEKDFVAGLFLLSVAKAKKREAACWVALLASNKARAPD
jgi:hypothetical protein